MGVRFFPVETFDAVVRGHRNRYLAGQRYTVRDGAAYDDLRRQVEEWAREGKVRLGPVVVESRPTIEIATSGVRLRGRTRRAS